MKINKYGYCCFCKSKLSSIHLNINNKKFHNDICYNFFLLSQKWDYKKCDYCNSLLEEFYYTNKSLNFCSKSCLNMFKEG